MAATAQEEADGGQARTEQTVGRRRRRADGARSGRDGRPTTGGATADGRELAETMRRRRRPSGDGTTVGRPDPRPADPARTEASCDGDESRRGGGGGARTGARTARRRRAGGADEQGRIADELLLLL